MTDKLDMQSPNWVHKNTQFIAEHFPNCVTETAEGIKVDFDLLKQELSTDIIEGNKERYRLEWPGKREAIVTANLPTTKTLRPIREDSVNFDTTENVYIEGDNLEVLKLLQENYLGKIKMVYIDPPYNTGKDFVYKDNFKQDSENYKEESGQKDEYNQRLFVNPETAGRYHSNWLSMMYPRLKLARNLLMDDGVIFISIDDKEVDNLKKICSEIFGDGNFIANAIWEKKFAPSNDAKWFSDNHDHILVFAKNKQNWRPNLLERDEKTISRYKNPDNDSRGVWASGDMTVKTYNAKYDFEIITPSGNVITPPEGICWRFSKEKVEELRKDNRIWFGKEGKNVPRVKRFLTEVKAGVTPLTIWYHKDVGHNQEAYQEVRKLFSGKQYFSTPKPIRLLSRMIHISTDDDSIMLDFFAGSSSSAHSIMDFNREKFSNRKYIQVQLPEATDEKSEAYKGGYKNICEIGKERLRRAGKAIIEEQQSKINPLENKIATIEEKLTKLKTDNKLFKKDDPKVIAFQEEIKGYQAEITQLQGGIDNLDIGFRVYRLDSSNMKDVYYKPQDYSQATITQFTDNVKADRTADDLLAQVMLDWGLPLSLPIEQATIAGKEVFKVAGNSLYACFDIGVDEAFAKAIAVDAPLRIVFKDSGFKNDTAKTNVKQLLKQLSPSTEMKVL